MTGARPRIAGDRRKAKRGDYECTRACRREKKRFGATDIEPIGSTPEQLGTYVRSEIGKWAKVIKETGMRAE